MGRVAVAFKAFFKSLFDTEVADRVGHALLGEAGQPKLDQPELVPKKPARSEAVTLLAALQREARFVDFVKEPLDELTDEQVGAAVRDIHRNLAAVVNRMFGPQPVLDDNEGESIEVPKGFDAGRYRLIGQVSGAPPYKGVLTHHGWKVATCQLPEWSGTEETASVIAAAEIEIK